jgi:hypothetical protein
VPCASGYISPFYRSGEYCRRPCDLARMCAIVDTVHERSIVSRRVGTSAKSTSGDDGVPKRIVILGAGFAGMNVVQTLERRTKSNHSTPRPSA